MTLFTATRWTHIAYTIGGIEAESRKEAERVAEDLFDDISFSDFNITRDMIEVEKSEEQEGDILAEELLARHWELYTNEEITNWFFTLAFTSTRDRMFRIEHIERLGMPGYVWRIRYNSQFRDVEGVFPHTMIVFCDARNQLTQAIAVEDK